MAKLFGFSIDDSQNKAPSVVSPVPKSNEDGVDHFVQSGFYGQFVDIEGVYKNEYDLIRRYREMALHPECDGAIEDVVNEAIVSDLYDSPVEIELSNVNASDKVKDSIRREFKGIKEMMDFDKKSHEIFRNWYVDGRLYYMKVIDTKAPQDGIQEIRYIDPMKMKFVRQEKKSNKNIGGIDLQNTFKGNEKDLYPEIEEFYIYTPKPVYPTGPAVGGSAGNSKSSIKIAKDSITYVTSGLFDRNKGSGLSYLHKAIKALNHGNLPKVKAEQYLRDVMMRYRNKLVYDANTGEVRDDRKFMSMMEDFWLPRREGGRGTEITTLPGGQNLGELADIEYFQKKLYRALSVPESRIANDGGFNLGRSSEILRDELKFSKFVGRLRKRFANMFNDMLSTQLILKNIIAPEDWEQLNDHIQYDFVYDNQFAELKESELMNERLGTLATIEPYIGKYYSNEYVRRKVLRQSDSEMEEIDDQIEKEIKDGTIPDPDAIDPITGEPLPPGTEEDVMAMGGAPEEAADAAITNDQVNKDTKLAEI
jgi:hypothetical protein